MFQSAEKPCKHENLIFLFTGSCGVACFSMWRSPVNTKIGFLVYRILWSRVFQYAEKPCKHENWIFLFTGSCGVECFSPVEKPCKHENPIVLFTGSYGVECFSLQRNPVNTKIRFSCLQDLVGSSVKCFYRVSLCRLKHSTPQDPVNTKIIFSCLQVLVGSSVAECFSLRRNPVNTNI